VPAVADPADAHPRVSQRLPILELDLKGKSVLCISTMEHVGSGEYGLQADPVIMRKSVDKLFAEAASFLVTVPVGYNDQMDRIVFGDLPDDVSKSFLVRRTNDPYWEETADPDLASRKYIPWVNGMPPGPFGANCIAVWERGDLLATNWSRSEASPCST